MKKYLLFTVVACANIINLQAQQAGTLDNTFGNSGKVFTYFNSKGGCRTVLLQPDGSIVAVGSTDNTGSKMALARYLGNGTPDAGFGNNGVIEQTIKGFSESATVGLLQPDGKIIAAGYAFNQGGTTNDDFTLVRYNSNGSIDNTFGVNGIAMNDLGGGLDRIWGAALQPDGKIVVVGESASTVAPYNYSLIVARYKTNGTFDSSFGINGSIAATQPTKENIVGRSVAIQPDGKIVAVGVFTSGGVNNFCAARLNANGTPDNTFGTNGIVNTLVAQAAQSQSVAIQPDGKIIIAGTSNDPARGYFTMIRYNANGSPDNTFGTNGIVQSNVGNTSWGMAVKLQPNGKILLTGYGTTIIDQVSTMCFLMARYNTNGSLDATFGTNGAVFTPMGSNSAYSNAIAIQADSKIILGGSSNFFGGFGLARYMGDSVQTGPVSIAETANYNTLKLYPNPAHHTATLQYSLSAPAQVSINITDIAGRIIKTLPAQQEAAGIHTMQLHLENIPAGTYTISLQGSDKPVSVKMIKE